MAQATQQTGEKRGWFMSVQEMPRTKGAPYPVFEWSFGAEHGIRGGELRAWPLQGILVFETRRGEGPWNFSSVQEALVKIDEYGWGKPSHIDEVFEDVTKTRAKLRVEGVKNDEEAKKIFEDLRTKWQALAASKS